MVTMVKNQRVASQDRSLDRKDRLTHRGVTALLDEGEGGSGSRLSDVGSVGREVIDASLSPDSARFLQQVRQRPGE